MMANNPSSELVDEHRAEFFRLSCCLMRLVLMIVTETAAKTLGKRFELLSRSVILQGHTDAAGVAARLGMTERGAEALLERSGSPYVKPGGTRLYAIEELVTKGGAE